MITMGNFFSGSGAWELAAKICGIECLWESEIEPFPVALEAKRFPNAVQLGDIRNVDGSKIAPVDILTNSSPCQDLSVAGRRDGLSGQRSSLFHEVIRITKEMREHERCNGGTDDDIRPKLWCWENVPGALSSSRGEDFRIVLEEVARIIEPTATIPLPEKGRWGYAGVVDGDGWQIAWRVLDSQFFGVAQRRRRLFLVCDFAGRGGRGRAAEVLFERESVSWDFAKIAETWKDTARSLEDRIAEAGRIVECGIRKTQEGVDMSRE